MSDSWNLGRIRVHLPFIRGFTYCPGAPLGTPSRKYQNKAPLAQSTASRDAGLMNELSGAAEKAVQLLSVLDTTTAAALAIDTELPRLKIDADAGSAVIGFAIVGARIERLQHRAERTLADLECQTGPERLCHV